MCNNKSFYFVYFTATKPYEDQPLANHHPFAPSSLNAFQLITLHLDNFIVRGWMGAGAGSLLNARNNTNAGDG